MTDPRQKQIETLKQAFRDGKIDLDAYTEAVARLSKNADVAGTVAIGDNTSAVAPRAVLAGNVSAPITTGDTLIFHSPKPGASKEELRRAYLTRLSLEANQLPLFAGDSAGNQIRLLSIYTALLTQDAMAQGLATVSLASMPEPSDEHDQRESIGKVLASSIERVNQPASVLDAANRHSKLVLLGGPGSGKSTFVNYVALCMAGELLGDVAANLKALTAPIPPDRSRSEDKPKPQRWDHGPLLPVHIVLRDFAAELPRRATDVNAKTLWQHIARRLSQAALGEYADHLRAELVERGGLILLDGLDEVPEAVSRREQIKQAVQDFAKSFTRCRYLVTSRTYAYTRQAWKLQGFVEVSLRVFSITQIERFVDAWYAHMTSLTRLTRDDASGRAELLKRTVRSSDRIRELAERPLLLTLIARLQTEGAGALPEKREELYAEAVDLLLTQWESLKIRHRPDGSREIEPSMAEFLKTGRDEIRRELDKLAFEAHRDQPNLAGTADIQQERLVKALLDASQNPDIKPRLVGQYLRDRAGIVAAHGEETYQFPHRTVQEYLAACHLTAFQFPDELTRLAKADPGRWREAALLAAAKVARGTPEGVWTLVEALCPLSEPPATGAEPALPELWGAFLAGQALLETGLAEPNIKVAERNEFKRQRVQRWTRAILECGWLATPDRVSAGQALSVLGDDRDFEALIPIPAGKFWMGEDSDNNAKPRHEVTLDSFEIGKYPVTNAQFMRFARATSDYSFLHSGADRADVRNLPATWLNWFEASDYCDWLTGVWQSSGKIRPNVRVRLPSEAEWEKAARFTDGRRYPWGNKWHVDHANTSESRLGRTLAVGAFPLGASLYGCCDMAGTVWEWTRSPWGIDRSGPDFRYPYLPNDIKPADLWESGTLTVVRGGSFEDHPRAACCTFRHGYPPSLRTSFHGFRVVVAPFS